MINNCPSSFPVFFCIPFFVQEVAYLIGLHFAIPKVKFSLKNEFVYDVDAFLVSNNVLFNRS